MTLVISDAMICLVGENNIPNVQITKKYLKDDGSLLLLSTNHTRNYASALKRYFKHNSHICVESNVVSGHDPEEIQDAIIEWCSSLSVQRVGLNYTGSTKFMAVTAYSVIKRFGEDNQLLVSYYYLDYTQKSIIVSNDKSYNYDTDYTGAVTRIGEMVQLHLSARKVIFETKVVLPDTAHALLNLYYDGGKPLDEWLKFKKVMKRQAKENPKLRHLSLPRTPHLSDLISVIEKEASGVEGYSLPISLFEFMHGVALENASRWFDGSWLESFVYHELLELKDKLEITDLGYSLRVYPKVGTQFEVDVFFICNDILFLVSCTADLRRPNVKKKMFEVIERGRLLGGSGSRVCMVSMYKDTESLLNEVKGRKSQTQHLVIGKSEILSFKDHIKRWVAKNS